MKSVVICIGLVPSYKISIKFQCVKIFVKFPKKFKINFLLHKGFRFSNEILFSKSRDVVSKLIPRILQK